MFFLCNDLNNSILHSFQNFFYSSLSKWLDTSSIESSVAQAGSYVPSLCVRFERFLQLPLLALVIFVFVYVAPVPSIITDIFSCVPQHVHNLVCEFSSLNNLGRMLYKLKLFLWNALVAILISRIVWLQPLSLQWYRDTVYNSGYLYFICFLLSPFCTVDYK